MRKVFMLAYQYPPMGGPGVQRTLKFTKYLRDFNWEPIVFTINKSGSIADPSLIQDIPKDMEIIRTKAYDFEDMKGICKYPGKFIARKVLIPDGAALWYWLNRKKAYQYVKNNNVDVIYSTSYPYSDHLMALQLKKRFPHIVWVADFRDEWMNNPYLLDNPYNRLRMNIEKKMERSVVRYADKIIANTPVMMKNFIKEYSVFENKFSCIPNGFDQDDFIAYKNTAHKKRNEKLTFTYTGMLYGRRKPDLFLECVNELIQNNVIREDQISVQFIGKFLPGYFDRFIEQYQMNRIITVFDYMPHKQCIQKLIESDFLLLLEGAGPGGEAFYTGKLFEYMNAGRPIAAFIPEHGVAADLIKESKTGYVADCDDKNQILNMLEKIIHLWYNHKLEYNPDYSVINRFERKSLTGCFANLLNECKEEANENSQ